MALARLAAAHQQAGLADVVAFTVDHGLRHGSDKEAALVGEWCASAGLCHHILAWHGDKPKSAIQEAARNARYGLLSRAAIDHGCHAILTGHTSDDQAETVYMRLARGAGPRGLAAMESVSHIASGAYQPVALVRPFLGVSRIGLRRALSGFGQDYINDPSNDDLAYERIRTRKTLAALSESSDISRGALLKTAASARIACNHLAAEELKCFSRGGGVFYQSGPVSLNASVLGDYSVGLLLRQLLFAVSGARQPVAEEQVEALVHECGKKGIATLSGAIIRRMGEKIWLYREPAALLGRAGVAPIEPFLVEDGDRVLWDRRFLLHNQSGEPLEIVPSGAAGEACDMANAPPEARMAAPMVRGGQSQPVKNRQFLLKSLVEERFFRRVNRFQ